MIERFRHFDPARQRLSFRRSLMAMLGLACVAMLVGFDQTIVGTALPRIVAELHGFNFYAWIATSYMLASVITIPVFGRLGDRFGRKPFLVAAILLFSGASLLCALAPSMLFLIVARGLQGIGGGILIGTAFATVADLFPDPRLRIRWLAIVSLAFTLTNALGPTLGGWLVQIGGWRLAFLVNVPVGLVALACVARYVPRLRRTVDATCVRVDWLGATLLVALFGLLHLMVDLSRRFGVSALTLGIAGAVFVVGALLWLRERRVDHPILPLDMLVDRSLWPLFAISMLGGFSLFSIVFYVPLLFQGGFAMSPHSSGMLITPLLLGTSAGSLVNNQLVTRVRCANSVIYSGFALCAFACIGVVLLDGKTPHLLWMALMGTGGLGLGLIGNSLTICSQQIVAREQLGSVTAMLQSLRTLGGVIGTMLTGALMGRLYEHGIYRSLNAYQATQWFRSLASPSLLIDRSEQAALIVRLAGSAHSGERMMHAARQTLVWSIHLGLGLTIAAALLGFCLTWWMPPLRVEAVRHRAVTA